MPSKRASGTESHCLKMARPVEVMLAVSTASLWNGSVARAKRRGSG